MDSQLTITIQGIEQKKLRSTKGEEYWIARDIQRVLAYKTWRSFEQVIDKAKMACDHSDIPSRNHFAEISKKVKIGSGAMVPVKDYCLTRYACYLITMNADAAKPEIATAQTYFAVQTRRQEVQDMVLGEDKRILLRDRIKKANTSLFRAAKKSGVTQFGVFQGAGYLGLYDMNLADIKKQKGLPQSEELLDRAGRTELAANEFRITQTEDKLVRDKVNSGKLAQDVHYKVGRQVRHAIEQVGGTPPEKLKAEMNIKQIEKRRAKEKSVITQSSIEDVDL